MNDTPEIKLSEAMQLEIKLADALLLLEALQTRRKNDLKKYRLVREQYMLQLKHKLEGKGIEGFDGFMESLITWIDNRISDCEEEIETIDKTIKENDNEV